ncbi:unnamed protein product, partial [marine sediment metagenome]
DFERTGAGTRSFNVITRYQVSSNINAIGWKYDNQYIAVGTDKNNAGGAHELTILYFDGSVATDTLSVDLNAGVYSIEWHPTDSYIVMANQKSVYPEVAIYLVDPTNGILTSTSGINTPNQSAYAARWHKSGDYIAVGRYEAVDTVAVYPFAGGIVDYDGRIVADTFPVGQISIDALDWDPTGSYFAVGAQEDVGGTELLIYHFDGASLTLTVSAEIGQTVLSIDWMPTSSLIAIGLAGGTERLLVYNFDISNGTLLEEASARIGVSDSVLSLDWDSIGYTL